MLSALRKQHGKKKKKKTCYLGANMPERRCCVLLMDFFPQQVPVAMRFVCVCRYASSVAVRGEETYSGCFHKTPVQSHLSLSRQFLNSSPHSSISALPVSAFPSPSSLPKLLHDKQMAPMRLCRGLAHGNVSWPHIAFGLKTDATCRAKELGVPFIAACLFCPSLD